MAEWLKALCLSHSTCIGIVGSNPTVDIFFCGDPGAIRSSFLQK